MRLALAAAALFLFSATSAGAHGPGAGRWSWTPALCKSFLVTDGVRIDDGRVFRASRVFCGGKPECTYDRSERKHYYDHFFVALIDNNLVFRTMDLHVTAKSNFRVDGLRVYGRAETKADVARFETRIKASVAQVSRATQPTCKVEP